MEKYPTEYNEEIDKLKDMIVKHNTSLLVVGANCMAANWFRTFLWDLASNILTTDNIEPWVAFGPCDVPLIYSTSSNA